MDSIDIFLYVADALIIIGAILALGMPLIKSFDNPKSLVKTVGGIVVLVIVFFVAYSISDGDVLPKFAAEPFNITETSSKMVGGILLTTYILFIVAMVGIVITELNKAIK
jgi:uncharacterized membrane protein